MKISIIYVLVLLILSSTENTGSNNYKLFYNNIFDTFTEIIKALNLTQLYELIDNSIDKIGEVCNADKKEIAQKLAECILYAIKVYKSKPEAIEKLKSLLEKLNNLGIFDSEKMKMLRGFYYLDYEKIFTPTNLKIYNYITNEKNAPRIIELFPVLFYKFTTYKIYWKDHINAMEALKKRLLTEYLF